MILGYLVPQHHFATEPVGLMKTDLPARIFRNKKEIRFFGIVHEHPEIALNKGLGKVTIAQGLSIMHTAYATEKIRRERFQRNFPLMEREYKKHKERYLTKFLYLRDLHNLMIYNIEKGLIRIKQNYDYANKIISLWEELLNTDRLRMVLDALQYYSRAVEFLGKGIIYNSEIELALNKTKPEKIKIIGFFNSRGNLSKLLNLLISESTKYFESKYL